MFQTGYLTITDYDESADQYVLGFPNKEVREAFLESLVSHFADLDTEQNLALQQAIERRDFNLFIEKVKTIIASFPYQLFARANEATYHAIFFAILRGVNLSIRAEEPTHLGRIDLVINSPNCTYIVEIKLNKSCEKALQQIQEKKYYQSYQHKGKDIALIGINFSSESRTIQEWRGALYSDAGIMIGEILPPEVLEN